MNGETQLSKKNKLECYLAQQDDYSQLYFVVYFKKEQILNVLHTEK